jgi:hypothetical protein
MAYYYFHKDIAEDLEYCIFGLKLVSIKSKRIDPPGEVQALMHRRNLSKFTNLLHDPYRSAIFTIRTIVNPHSDNQSIGKIEIALLVKIPVNSASNNIQEQILTMESNLKLILGGVFSNYIWDAIQEEAELKNYLYPLNWSEAFISDLRRREEVVQLDTFVPQKTMGFMGEEAYSINEESHEGVYYVHPFFPTKNGFETLLNTLIKGNQKIVLTASLSPTKLTSQEEQFLREQIAVCEGHKDPQDLSERVQKQRAANLGQALLQQYLVLQDAPYYLTFTAASQKPLDYMILEYIGLSITEPIGYEVHKSYPMPYLSLNEGGYDIVVPLTEKDLEIARDNMANLTQKPWQTSHPSADRNRLRFLFHGNEAICAFYLPINIYSDIPGVDIFIMDQLPLPRELVELQTDEASNILIGKNYYFGFEQNVIIPEDTRRQHTYIIGQTGTGKTTLMQTMILSDMKAGNGLAVIDPHGELYQDILEAIPEDRKEDVVLFDPSDVGFPIGFNLLEVSTEEEKEYIVKELRAILKRFFVEHFGITDIGGIIGPIFFTHVQNNLLLAMSDDDNPGTIVEFKAIFDSEDFWKRWLPLKWKNRLLENWTKEILPNTDYMRKGSDGVRYGDYFSAKFEDFVNDPRINLIFGQPYSTIDFADVVENNKILLINLSKGLLGEANASLLGMMLMAKLNSVFMQRMKNLSRNTKLNPFYLYVDEFQNIATENFSILLAEARKFGLGLILANQYMKQVSDHKILDAIIGNVGTIISFRLGIEDAKIMANQYLPHYEAQDISELPNYYAILRTNVEGERTIPCNFKTVLTPHSEHYVDVDDLVNLSRNKYSTPKNVADFLVGSSLAFDRMRISEYYWEKPGTPKDQLLTSLNWKKMLPLFYSEEETIHTKHKQINNQAMREIFHFLTNESLISRSVVGELLEQNQEEGIVLIDNMSQHLVDVFEPAIGGTTQAVRGVYNNLIRDLLHDKLFEVINKVENEDNEGDEYHKSLSDIWTLCKRDHWLAAGTNIARMWRNHFSTISLAEQLFQNRGNKK